MKSSTALSANDNTATIATGGIDLDSQFRPKFDKALNHNLYCVSIPFLLHKLPFVQGITSTEELASFLAKAILKDVGHTGFGFDVPRKVVA